MNIEGIERRHNKIRIVGPSKITPGKTQFVPLKHHGGAAPVEQALVAPPEFIPDQESMRLLGLS